MAGELTIKAVVDRFEGNTAILLVGEEQRLMDVSKILLPKEVKEGSWLKVVFLDGKLIRAEIDAEEEVRVRQRIAEKRAALLRGDHLKE